MVLSAVTEESWYAGNATIDTSCNLTFVKCLTTGSSAFSDTTQSSSIT